MMTLSKPIRTPSPKSFTVPYYTLEKVFQRTFAEAYEGNYDEKVCNYWPQKGMKIKVRMRQRQILEGATFQPFIYMAGEM